MHPAAGEFAGETFAPRELGWRRVGRHPDYRPISENGHRDPVAVLTRCRDVGAVAQARENSGALGWRLTADQAGELDELSRAHTDFVTGSTAWSLTSITDKPRLGYMKRRWLGPLRLNRRFPGTPRRNPGPRDKTKRPGLPAGALDEVE